MGACPGHMAGRSFDVVLVGPATCVAGRLPQQSLEREVQGEGGSYSLAHDDCYRMCGVRNGHVRNRLHHPPRASSRTSSAPIEDRGTSNTIRWWEPRPPAIAGRLAERLPDLTMRYRYPK